ncbi:hypothetical protein KY332_04210 [Candidatus Woesearchaeota archaeon]|nr:hypothetical protein [Candidatus Woesearchaeota archaeon]
MNKKGQLTIALIIGIALIVIFAFIFILRGMFIEEVEIPEIQPVRIYVESCLESTAIDAVQIAGIQGGYTDIPDPALTTDYSIIAYYYYDGEPNVPSKGIIEAQISTFIMNNIDICLADFSSFKEQGFEIETEEAFAETVIREDDIFVKLEYPITISRNETKTKIEDYSATIPIRLGHIHDVAIVITSKTAQDPKWIDMTLLSEFDVTVNLIPEDEENIVYTITDELSMINNEPYTFLFANKFIVNQPPVLDIPDMLTLEDGKPVAYTMQATDPENDVLTFSDDTAMFDITEDGIILFTPEVPGEFNITITVEDTHRNIVSKVVKFVITE